MVRTMHFSFRSNEPVIVKSFIDLDLFNDRLSGLISDTEGDRRTGLSKRDKLEEAFDEVLFL